MVTLEPGRTLRLGTSSRRIQTNLHKQGPKHFRPSKSCRVMPVHQHIEPGIDYSKLHRILGLCWMVRQTPHAGLDHDVEDTQAGFTHKTECKKIKLFFHFFKL